ncbi:MAG: GNAT family N-acetyltransferase [Bacteroidetes bacterium]|nr:GNAT family N-acetyltransferase [Bacteroidota bacterium]
MQSETIILRALEPNDIDFLYQWENDTNLWYLSNSNTPFSRFVLEQFILNAHLDIYTNKQLRLMIDLKAKPKNITIGCIDIFDFDPINKRAGIGILISDGFREKGHASESLKLLIDYAFENLQLHQMYCNISEDNEASLKLFKNRGFEIIGLKRDWNWRNENWIHEYSLQLIKNN